MCMYVHGHNRFSDFLTMSMDPSNTSEDAQQGSSTSLSLSKEDLSYIAASVAAILKQNQSSSSDNPVRQSTDQGTPDHG